MDLISGMFKISPVFPTLTVSKPLVTEGTNGSQMKDMDLIFPLIPYDGVLYLASGATVSSSFELYGLAYSLHFKVNHTM